MSAEKVSTHDQLLETAGRLFAEHGFRGTSIQMIASATGQNIAAVNYHFGSKQNLLIETLKFILGKIMTPIPGQQICRRASPLKELKNYIEDRCKFLLCEPDTLWYGKLVVRAGFEMSLNIKDIEFYKPDFDYLEQLATRIKPGLPPQKAKYWAYSIVGQIFFYVYGRDMILLANQQSVFTSKTIQAIAAHIFSMVADWLISPESATHLHSRIKTTKSHRPAANRS